MKAVVALGLLLILQTTTVLAATVYKYQTSDGRWHYSDTPPEQPARSAETLDLEPRRSRPAAPVAQVQTGPQGKSVIARNPWAGPVEMLISLRTTQYQVLRQVVDAGEEVTVYRVPAQTQIDVESAYVPGAPLDSLPPEAVYAPPLAPGAQFQISQGIRGPFTHNRQPSLYAIDIAMPLGSPIHAARDGVVMAVEDHFVIGSASSAYFYDKANYVMVLHEDGTNAVYAHVLQGSVEVAPGQRIRQGDLIARSGNSGFSTGPHLHFVVRANYRGKLVSIPVNIADAQGNGYPLQKGTVLEGWP